MGLDNLHTFHVYVYIDVFLYIYIYINKYIHTYVELPASCWDIFEVSDTVAILLGKWESSGGSYPAKTAAYKDPMKAGARKDTDPTIIQF